MSLTSNPVRKVVVSINLSDGSGETVKSDVTVYYKSQTTKEAREVDQKFKDGKTVFVADILAERLIKFVESDGTETPVTPDLLDDMAIENLTAIESAIEANTAPK